MKKKTVITTGKENSVCTTGIHKLVEFKSAEGGPLVRQERPKT